MNSINTILVDQCPSGRNLDVAVAKAMGWRRLSSSVNALPVSYDRIADYWGLYPPDFEPHEYMREYEAGDKQHPKWDFLVSKYSTNIALLPDIIKWLLMHTTYTRVSSIVWFDRVQYFIHWDSIEHDDITIFGEAVTDGDQWAIDVLPLATCRAFLKAMGIEQVEIVTEESAPHVDDEPGIYTYELSAEDTAADSVAVPPGGDE